MATLLYALLLFIIPLSSAELSIGDKKETMTIPPLLRHFETYGVDLRSCNNAMCWASPECGGTRFHSDNHSEPIVIIDDSFDAHCRNVVYIQRQTSHSIVAEVMWESNNIIVSMKGGVKNEAKNSDLFVCSSTDAKEDGRRIWGVATTTYPSFVLYQRSMPRNLAIEGPDGAARPLTYCRFDIKLRSKLGDFMKREKVAQLCIIMKMDSARSVTKCLTIREKNDYYNKFNSNREFNESASKVYTVFLVAYVMLLALLVMPIYSAFRESLVNFRDMRAFFKFRRTLTELPEQDIVNHHIKRKSKGIEPSDPIAVLIEQARAAEKEAQA